MESRVILKILAIPLIGLLISCGKEKAKDKKVETYHKEIASDTIFDSNNPYYIFIKKNNPEALKDNKLIYFKEEDIDLDGKKEALVAFGVINENLIMQTVNEVFLLRNDNGTIKEIENNFETLGNIIEVEIVSLEGIKQNLICLSIIKGGSSNGFVLFELKGNKMNELFYVTPLGEGSCYLTDKNNDGKYDGYSKSFRFSDTVTYDVEESFVFKNNEFKPSENHVKISDYPVTIQELVLQYISLRSLYISESSEVKLRLKQICTDLKAPTINWNKDAWSEACSKYYDDSEKFMKVEIQDGSNIAIITYTDEDQNQYQLEFELEKSNNKWQITKVTILKNGSK